MTIRFKVAEKSDVPSLLEMVQDYHEYDHLPFDEKVIRPVLERLIEEDSLGRAWLIRYLDETVGYAFLTFGYSVEYLGRNAFLDELYIKSEFRGKGWGRQALELAKK